MGTALVTLASSLSQKYGMGEGGEELVAVLKATVFKGPATDAQLTALLAVAKEYGLNPFTKEIYAFPDKNNGIVPVVGVDGWARIINSHPQFDGMDFEKDGESCTCIMYRKDRSRPVKISEYMDECKRGTPPWQSHPRRMLRHRAMIQCARIAFGFGGIVDQDEAERITEIDMGTAEVVDAKPAAPKAPPALPAYPADQFATNLPMWRAAIEDGKVSAEQIISRSSSKYILSEHQKAEIRKPPAAEPSMFEKVKASLINAKDADTLDVAADLIGQEQDDGNRAELTRIYHERRAALAG